MCIYYQDELGFCCKNGSNWEDFNKNTLCNSKREETCPDRITVKEAEEMKQKLWLITELLRNAPISSDEVADIVMKIIVDGEL